MKQQKGVCFLEQDKGRNIEIIFPIQVSMVLFVKYIRMKYLNGTKSSAIKITFEQNIDMYK